MDICQRQIIHRKHIQRDNKQMGRDLPSLFMRKIPIK